ncbi:MAG: CocE/NonD family hydrolase [Armatimonadota bacterium]|jgi:predicted acyl esterase
MLRADRLWLLAVILLAGSMPSAADVQSSKQTVSVPVRDGSGLATDVYLPADYAADAVPDGLPVILVCLPYGKDRGGPIEAWRETFLSAGYAFVVQDMRGFYDSADAGRGRPRRHDGYDTIEWLAEQPWCSGRVGMMGYSHLGAAQYEAAVTDPPHLACAIPAQAPGNYYTDSFFPPVFRKADWETILRGAFSERTQQLINKRIRSHGDTQIANFNVPMLHSAGWFDFYKEGAIEMFRALQEHGGPRARGNQKLLIGPWGHGVLQEHDPGQPLVLPGGMVFPANAKLDWRDEVWLPWYDHWLKDEPTGVTDQPAVRYYLMGATDHPEAPGNEWVEAESFPPESSAVSYYPHADGTLRREPPLAEEASWEYVYDPADPVPTVGRTHAQIPVTGPYDQRPVEDRPDVLVFTTEPLDGPLIIVGQIRATLWASSDRTDTDFTVKLTDVYPDGRSMVFADGIVRARYRESFLQEALLTPRDVYEFEIDLGHIAIVLAPEHRLRLAVSSSNFDRFDINPNTGEPLGDHALTRALLAQRFGAPPAPGEPAYTQALVATNTVYMDRGRSSRVILPVLP